MGSEMCIRDSRRTVSKDDHYAMDQVDVFGQANSFEQLYFTEPLTRMRLNRSQSVRMPHTHDELYFRKFFHSALSVLVTR